MTEQADPRLTAEREAVMRCVVLYGKAVEAVCLTADEDVHRRASEFADERIADLVAALLAFEKKAKAIGAEPIGTLPCYMAWSHPADVARGWTNCLDNSYRPCPRCALKALEVHDER